MELIFKYIILENQKEQSDIESLKQSLAVIIEGKEYAWTEQYISGLQLKALACLPLAAELYLSISEPWKDELVANEEIVDLARPSIESFFVKQQLEYTINGQVFSSIKQYILGSQIRKEGNIPEDQQIFLAIKGPWEDELVKDTDRIDLARPGIEKFYSKPEDVKIVIIVNGTPHSWNKKQIGFKEVVVLAFGQYIDLPTMVYTVAYEDGPKENPEGSMFPKQEIFTKNKMIFHATATDKS